MSIGKSAKFSSSMDNKTVPPTMIIKNAVRIDVKLLTTKEMQMDLYKPFTYLCD